MTPAESEQLRAELAGTEYSVPEPNVRFQNRIFGSSCSLGGRASRGVPGAGKLPIMLSWVHGIRLNACVGCTRCPINYGPINSWNRIFGSGTEHSVLGPNIRFRRAPGDPWSVPTASRWSLRKSGVVTDALQCFPGAPGAYSIVFHRNQSEIVKSPGPPDPLSTDSRASQPSKS